jgi:hypothetical protein
MPGTELVTLMVPGKPRQCTLAFVTMVTQAAIAHCVSRWHVVCVVRVADRMPVHVDVTGYCPLGDYYGTSNNADYNIRFSIANDNSNPTGTARVWFNGHRSIAFVPDPSASASQRVRLRNSIHTVWPPRSPSLCCVLSSSLRQSARKYS